MGQKMVEFRIQKVDLDSPSGRLIEFIKKGRLGGVSLPPVQIALSMLSMCLQPYADKDSVSDVELKQRTRMAVELLLLHCKNLCSWAGLDFASFFAGGGNVHGNGVGNRNVDMSESRSMMESDSALDEEEDSLDARAVFSLSNANFHDLGL